VAPTALRAQGVAAEFLDRNVQDYANANTRCGVSYDNRVTTSPLPSPHGGTATIVHPANSVTTQAQYGLWSLARSYTTSSRTATVTYSVADFNQALTNCGWLRDESNPAQTVYRASVRITTVQQGRAIRGTLLAVSRETIVELGVAVRTGVSASATLETQSVVVALASVLKQTFDPALRVLSLLFFTSSQGPYQLRLANPTLAPVCTSSDCAGRGWAGASGATLARALLPGDLSALALATHSSGVSNTNGAADNRRAECFVADSDGSGNPAAASYSVKRNSAPPYYDPCGQYWFLSLQPEQPGNTCETSFASHTARTASGTWQLTFDVTCHSTYSGSCAAPSGGAPQPQVRAMMLSGVDRTQRSARAGCGLAEHVHRRLLSAPCGLCVGELPAPQCLLHPGHADAVTADGDAHSHR
jgi:hypothetical protein